MPLSKVHIRKACLRDLYAIKALADSNKDALGFLQRSVLSAGIEMGWMLIAEDTQYRIIGFVHYRHRQDHQTTLYEICVEETCRGYGIGRSLFESLSLEAVSLGKQLIRLKSPVDLAANKFYERLGGSLIGVEQGKLRNLNVWQFDLDGKGKA